MSVQFPRPGPPPGRPDEQAQPASVERDAALASIDGFDDSDGTPEEPAVDVTLVERAARQVEVDEAEDSSGSIRGEESATGEAHADEPEDQSAEVEGHERAPVGVTGNHAVDRVLDSLDALADRPVDEHVAVFEQAHEQLRGALDGPRLPRP